MTPSTSSPDDPRAARATARATRMSALLVITAVLATVGAPSVTADDDEGVPGLESPLEMLWEATPPGSSDEPPPVTSVAIDPQGRIWAATGDSVFEIYDRDGNHLETFGWPGSGEGEFDFINEYGVWGDVAFRSDGGFYVSDADNARIQQFDADGSFVRAAGSFGSGDGQFVGPHNIRIDGAGNVYVMDPVRADVQVFDSELNHLRTFGYGEVGPFIDVDRDGSVYAAHPAATELAVYRPDGSVETIANLDAMMSFITGIERTADGRTYVASELDGGSVTGPEHLAEVAADGTVKHLWPNGGWTLALDPAGDRVYMAIGDLRAYALPTE